MAYGIIQNGVIVNAVEASDAFAAERGWVKLTGGAAIGWNYADGVFKPPASPVVDPSIAYVPVPLFRQRLEKLGLFEDFAGYLAQNPVLMLKVLSLEAGIDPAYPDLHTAFTTMSVPQDAQDYLLAPPSVGVPDV